MAVTQSARLGLTLWSSGADPLTRAQLLGDHQALDDLTAIDVQGATVGDRPAAGVRGRYFTALDTGSTFRDNGTTWTPVGMSLSSVAPAALPFGSGGAAGTSLMASRADHVHPTPAHDAAAHSAIKLSDLAAPTAAVAFGSQRITNLAAPTAATDAATKGYVDAAGVAWAATTYKTSDTTLPGGWSALFTLSDGTLPQYGWIEFESCLITATDNVANTLALDGSKQTVPVWNMFVSGPKGVQWVSTAGSATIAGPWPANLDHPLALWIRGVVRNTAASGGLTWSLLGSGSMVLKAGSYFRWRRLPMA